MFCREAVAELRRTSEADPEYPRVLLFHLGTPEEGDAFLGAAWPGARAVSDPDAEVYEAFSIGRGRIGQLLGPSVILRGLRALLGGHGVGKPVGDPLRMSGAVAIRDRSPIWSHTARHVGDHPDWAAIPAALPR